MTAATFGTVQAESTERRRPVLAPEEGWTTLGLVLLLCLTFAWSVNDPNWVPGPKGQTDFLAWAIGLGVAWGFLSAKVGWSRWLAHLLGAVLGVLLVAMMAGSVVGRGVGGPAEWFHATAASSVEAYLDIAFRGLPATTQIGHFLLVLGLLAWGTGQYAAYVTFHHRRPLNAVIVIGVGLVASMSLTIVDQLFYLVVYSLAGLFLLIRFHAYDERTLWLRRRIGDATALGGLYLRGGTVFVAGAVILSLFLTGTARSQPLASFWRGADQRFIDVGREVQRVFRVAGQGTRFTAVDFSGTAPIRGSWTTDGTPVLEIKVPDDEHYLWRAVAYDRFDGYQWTWSKPSEEDVKADNGLLGESADNPLNQRGARQVSIDVRELDLDPQSIFAPGEPVSVSVDSRLTTVSPPAGGAGTSHFAGLYADANAYTVKAMVPVDYLKDPVNGLTASQLEVAGTDYPASVRALYLDGGPALQGPELKALLDKIVARYPEKQGNAYDKARAITDYLTKDGGFTYRADVTDIDCGALNVVECFAKSKVGYCQHFASAMVGLLRMQGVPARFAEGFLPSERDAQGFQTIRNSNSHAWVEVYFPDYGWVSFDPTAGPVGQDVPLPQGPRVTAAPKSPRPSGSTDNETDPRRSLRPGESDRAGAGGTTGSPGSPGSGPFVVVGLLLAVAMGGLVFVAWQRGPRKPVEPDAAWRGVVGLARRFGFAPRPNQTVYEYSASLGEVLPNARPDLQTVARAKVEVAYGRREIPDERLRAIRDAQRRLRVALLALIFRRSARPRRRR